MFMPWAILAQQKMYTGRKYLVQAKFDGKMFSWNSLPIKMQHNKYFTMKLCISNKYTIHKLQYM